MKLNMTFVKIKNMLLWLGVTAFSIAASFGFRCPAEGCPCCKALGK